MPSTLILLIFFATGVIAGITTGVGWRTKRNVTQDTARQTRSPSLASIDLAAIDRAAVKTASDPPITREAITLTDLDRHDLNAPLQMILGYCDLWLSPTKSALSLLPPAAHDDLVSISRNARQAQTVIERLFAEAAQVPPIAASPDRHTAEQANTRVTMRDTPGAIVVLHPDSRAAEWLTRQLPDAHIVWMPTLAELARLPADHPPISLIVTAPDDPLEATADMAWIAGIAGLVGNHIPLVRAVLPETVQGSSLTHRFQYLSKPITHEKLSVAFAMFDAPIRSILIVDDHQDSVAMLDRLLIDLDPAYTIRKAYSGREGLSLMREQRPDLVLLDLHLPDINGLTIAQIMQIDPRLAAIPIVFMSARRTPEIPVGISLPVHVSLIKLNGFTSDELIDVIEALSAVERGSGG